MTGMARFKNFGAFFKGVFSDFTSVTAGGGGDGAEVDGAWISRQDFESLSVLLPFETTLGATETLSIALNLQHADDSSGTGVEDFGDAVANAVQATGAGGGSTETGVVKADFDLTEAKEFVRVQYTPTMSAGTTDTADIMSLLILGGAVELPAS